MTTQQHSTAGAPRKSRFESLVETLATTLGDSIGWLADHGVLFALFALIWLALGTIAVLNPSAIDDIWQQIGAQSIVVQLLLWLLFLPVMAGLWVWQTDWPDVLRVVVVVSLAAFTLLVMRPARGVEVKKAE